MSININKFGGKREAVMQENIFKDTAFKDTDFKGKLEAVMQENIFKDTDFKGKKIDIQEPNILSENYIKQLLNSKEYQDKRKEDRLYIEKNKKFKTVKISPLITYNVFDVKKIVDMTPPSGMSIDDYE